jgi:hypothetical protein
MSIRVQIQTGRKKRRRKPARGFMTAARTPLILLPSPSLAAAAAIYVCI